MARWFRKKLFNVAARVLTKPRGNYNRILSTDLETLRQTVRKGDVILVDGDQRVSEVIKYLTQSSWSHVALYVGDELLQRFPTRREELVRANGQDAQHLIVEALQEGVVASPLSKYAAFNLRVCRPHGLQRDDLQRVLNEVIAQLGSSYDLKNLLDLARYFFPVSLIPLPLPAPRAPLRQRTADRGDVLEPDRPRLPERRLPDPARDHPGGRAAPAPAPARLLPPHERPVPERLPSRARHADHAARLRPLALLRDRQAERPRGGQVRLPQDQVGVSPRGRAASRRAGFWRRGKRPLEGLQAAKLLLDPGAQVLGGVRHLAALTQEVGQLLVQPVALGLYLARLRLERRDAAGEGRAAAEAENLPGAVAEGAAHHEPEQDEGRRANAHRAILQSAGAAGP